jgi:hypothetical protein
VECREKANFEIRGYAIIGKPLQIKDFRPQVKKKRPPEKEVE